MTNKAILIGRVGNDPETKTFDNGGQITTISLATSESWKDKQGEKQERTEWHTIKFNDKLAEVVEKYVKKGDLLYIEGKIHHRKHEDNGVTKYYTDILCREMKMLGGKRDEAKPAEVDAAPMQREDPPF